MAERYLPIQFFEKRKDFDDRSTEGGGDTRIPSWVLSGEALISRSTQLTESVSDLSAVFAERKRQGRKLPMIVSTAIDEKAIAKSHRGNITSLYTTVAAMEAEKASETSEASENTEQPAPEKITYNLNYTTFILVNSSL